MRGSGAGLLRLCAVPCGFDQRRRRLPGTGAEWQATSGHAAWSTRAAQAARAPARSRRRCGGSSRAGADPPQVRVVASSPRLHPSCRSTADGPGRAHLHPRHLPIAHDPDLLLPSSSRCVRAADQSKVPSFPDDIAMALLEEELGQPWQAIYSELSPSPIAAASLGRYIKDA